MYSVQLLPPTGTLKSPINEQSMPSVLLQDASKDTILYLLLPAEKLTNQWISYTSISASVYWLNIQILKLQEFFHPRASNTVTKL